MQSLRYVLAVLCAGGVTAVVSGLTGCESSSTDAGINIRLENPSDRQPDAGELTIRPGESIVLVAEAANTNRNLFLPLEWSVSDPAVGQIVDTGGFTAAYRASNRAGSNVISVKDQSGAEGVTAINQRNDA